MTSADTPHKIGKYIIIREIGTGAASRVFLGHDPFSDRDVAIKVVRADPSVDPESHERFKKIFLNEASLAGHLVHPHIIAIHDADVVDDFGYIVMDYMEGSTLQRYCSPDNLLPVPDVIETTFKCALALDFAYQQGILHRDIKPANIMMSLNREIKVTGFGVAFGIGADQTHPTGGGSPSYMSPERISESDATVQGDIYSLGIVMYQLLTGRLPFVAGSTESLLHQIVNIDPTPPIVHRSDLPPKLNDIVMKATARSRDSRYPTWVEFAEDLSALQDSLTLPPGSLHDVRKFGALKAVRFFEAFSERELWEIVRSASFRRIAPRETVVREGEICDSFYLIESGEARVTRNNVSLSVLGDGDCFGEIPYFENRGVRRSSVLAITPMTIVEIKSRALQAVSDSCQNQFNRAFVQKVLIDRIDRLTTANTRLSEQLLRAALPVTPPR